MRLLGVDPGTSGGISLVGPVGTEPWAVKLKGLSAQDLLDIMYQAAAKADFAMMEKVHAQPGDGTRKMGASGAFTFGKNVGWLEMALTATGIPHGFVAPTVWQKEFGLLRKDKAEKITAKKNRHKAEAQRLFPGLTITHATADALLIAEYARRHKS